MTVWFLLGDEPTYSMNIDIEAKVYTAVLKWCPTDGYWYLDLLDEAEIVEQGVRGRRLLPIGPWLTVDAANRLPLRQFLRHYDLAAGFLPGALIVASSAPLTAPALAPYLPGGLPAAGKADALAMQLNYYTAADIASGALA